MKNNIISTKNKYNKILKDVFGYDSLKDEQYQIINAILTNKSDILAVLATGFGKSLCFQMPYLITNKCVIVISPLISLMADQKISMEKLGIPVCILNNTNSTKTADKQEIIEGNYKIIYITPEYLVYCKDFIIDLNENNGIILFCVDEAHCVSTYSDFRPSYLKLNVIKEWCPNIPLLALTATASQKVRDDIINTLKMNKKNLECIIGNFDRINLELTIKPKNSIDYDVIPLIERFKNEYIIIYCRTRVDTETMADNIKNNGYECDAYHAGLSNNIRNEIQEKYINGTIKCIAATISYGLGINIPNIRLIIHYGCPKNMEGYYQEIGRAGRDGKASECYLFYSSKDFMISKYFLKEIRDETMREYQSEQIAIMQKYVTTNECRRIAMLHAFDPSYNKTYCGNCDKCKDNKFHMMDLSYPSYLILSITKELNGKAGNSFIVNALRGSKAKNMTYIMTNKFYNTGKEFSEKWLKAIIRMLINNDYLIETSQKNNFGVGLTCTNKSLLWLKKIITTYKNISQNMILNEEDKIIMKLNDEMEELFNKSINKSKNKSKEKIKNEKYDEIDQLIIEIENE